MKGPLVGELQKIMLELNMKISKTGKVDNLFGPIMDLAIRQFQATNMPKGSKDGKVGRDTLNRMIEIRDYDGSEGEPEVDDSGTNDTNQMIEV
jgi:peptidoglycan hydrolase-like protein with peptidoglycan-binding domain